MSSARHRSYIYTTDPRNCQPFESPHSEEIGSRRSPWLATFCREILGKFGNYGEGKSGWLAGWRGSSVRFAECTTPDDGVANYLDTWSRNRESAKSLSLSLSRQSLTSWQLRSHRCDLYWVCDRRYIRYNCGRSRN